MTVRRPICAYAKRPTVTIHVDKPDWFNFAFLKRVETSLSNAAGSIYTCTDISEVLTKIWFWFTTGASLLFSTTTQLVS